MNKDDNKRTKTFEDANRTRRVARTIIIILLLVLLFLLSGLFGFFNAVFVFFVIRTLFVGATNTSNALLHGVVAFACGVGVRLIEPSAPFVEIVARYALVVLFIDWLMFIKRDPSWAIK